jgi:hypothetical protein
VLDDQRPGTVYWIDHYVVGSDDLERWAEFETNVIGARSMPRVGPPGGRQFIVFQDVTEYCHHGAMLSPDPLPPSLGLGKGLPRHGLFIRQSDIDEHLRRLDKFNVPHLDPIRTSAEGDDGISIQWEDPDGNQFEFWAPDRLPPGAMTTETSVKVGRISHGVYEALDLQRAADHFHKYCAMEPMVSADIPSDTIVLPTVNGARIVYKKVDKLSGRTGGFGKLHAAHAALVVRDEDFWPNYEYMWANVPEWPWDREARGFVGAGPELPARTSRHGSPGGVQWFEVRGRGDDWYDTESNCFHFMGGVPEDDEFTKYEPRTMDFHFPEYLKSHNLPMPSMPGH